MVMEIRQSADNVRDTHPDIGKQLDDIATLAKQEGVPDFYINKEKEENFTGKTVVVTGGNSGIGKELTRRFAMAGARVIAIDINPQLTETVDQINQEDESTNPIETIVADVGKHEQWFDQVQKLPKVDILLNVAAIIDPPLSPDNRESQPNIKDAMELARTPEGLAKLAKDTTAVFNTNFLGPHLLSIAMAEKMARDVIPSDPKDAKKKQQRNGVIINVGSTNVFTLNDRRLAYAPIKAALHLETQLMAKGLAPYGIRVNCVAPGATKDTDVVRDVIKAQERMPLGIDEVGDIADAILFLCSDKARNISGEVLKVDGARVVSM